MGTAATSTLGAFDVEGIDFAFDDIPDLHGVLADLRRRRPWAVVPFATTPGLLLLTNELVSAAFKDDEAFPAPTAYTMTTQATMGRSILCMSGREHRMNRSILSSPLRRKQIADYRESIIEPVIHELIDQFTGRGDAELVSEFTHRYSLLIISRMIGLPVTDEAQIFQWAQGLIHYPLDPAGAVHAAGEFTEYLTPLIEQRRRDPGQDMISLLVTATSDEGESLPDESILAFLRMLFPLGADTTMLALGNILTALLMNPDQLDLLRSDPAEHLEWAVWEGLRFEPSVGLLPRACPEAVTWHGIDIPAFTPVIFSINAANRDPQVYPRPDDFDITRKVTAMTSFGQGAHSCIGNWLAMAEISTALGALIDRLPNLRLQPELAHTVKSTSQVGTALRGPNTLPVLFDPA